MDAPFNTSVILLVAVALWLIWVAPYLLRRHKHALATDAAAVVPLQEAALPAVPAPRPETLMTMEIKQSQEIRMKTTSSTTGPGPSVPPLPPRPDFHGIDKRAAKSPAPLKIHYGRLFVALVGLLALLTTAVTGVLRLAGMIHGLIPATACAVFLFSLVLLRILAVRGRKKRLKTAFSDAMGTTTTSARVGGAASVPPRPGTKATGAGIKRAGTMEAGTGTMEAGTPGVGNGTGPAARGSRSDSGRDAQASRSGTGHNAQATRNGAERPAQTGRAAVVLFDGTAGAEIAAAKPAKPLTATELRNAALAVAAKGAADARVATTETLGEVQPWQPVQVPKPSYVAAARADRPAPAPLQLPEAPRPTGKTSIKATEAAAANQATEAAASQAAEAAVAMRGEAAEAKRAAEGPSEEVAEPAAPSAPDQAASKEPAAETAKDDSTSAPAAAGKSRSAHGLSNLDVVLQRRRA